MVKHAGFTFLGWKLSAGFPEDRFSYYIPKNYWRLKMWRSGTHPKYNELLKCACGRWQVIGILKSFPGDPYALRLEDHCKSLLYKISSFKGSARSKLFS